jgi:hypothetical protein
MLLIDYSAKKKDALSYANKFALPQLRWSLRFLAVTGMLYFAANGIVVSKEPFPRSSENSVSALNKRVRSSRRYVCDRRSRGLLLVDTMGGRIWEGDTAKQIHDSSAVVKVHGMSVSLALAGKRVYRQGNGLPCHQLCASASPYTSCEDGNFSEAMSFPASPEAWITSRDDASRNLRALQTTCVDHVFASLLDTIAVQSDTPICWAEMLHDEEQAPVTEYTSTWRGESTLNDDLTAALFISLFSGAMSAIFCTLMLSSFMGTKLAIRAMLVPVLSTWSAAYVVQIGSRMTYEFGVGHVMVLLMLVGVGVDDACIIHTEKRVRDAFLLLLATTTTDVLAFLLIYVYTNLQTVSLFGMLCVTFTTLFSVTECSHKGYDIVESTETVSGLSCLLYLFVSAAPFCAAAMVCAASVGWYRAKFDAHVSDNLFSARTNTGRSIGCMRRLQKESFVFVGLSSSKLVTEICDEAVLRSAGHCFPPPMEGCPCLNDFDAATTACWVRYLELPIAPIAVRIQDSDSPFSTMREWVSTSPLILFATGVEWSMIDDSQSAIGSLIWVTALLAAAVGLLVWKLRGEKRRSISVFFGVCTVVYTGVGISLWADPSFSQVHLMAAATSLGFATNYILHAVLSPNTSPVTLKCVTFSAMTTVVSCLSIFSPVVVGMNTFALSQMSSVIQAWLCACMVCTRCR